MLYRPVRPPKQQVARSNRAWANLHFTSSSRFQTYSLPFPLLTATGMYCITYVMANVDGSCHENLKKFNKKQFIACQIRKSERIRDNLYIYSLVLKRSLSAIFVV